MRTGSQMLMSSTPQVDMHLFLEVAQCHGGLDTASVETEWLRELLMDLPVVEKPLPVILMNCDNQTVIMKVNSAKDNAKSSRHVKRRLKSVRKMRNSGVITVSYIQTDKTWQIPLRRDYHAM